MTFAFNNNPHLFNKHLLSAYYVPGTILSIGNTAVKKSFKNSYPYRAYNAYN